MKKILLVAISALFVLMCVSTTSFAYSFGEEDFTLYDGTTPYEYGRSSAAVAANPSVDFQGEYLGTVYKDSVSNANDDLDTLLDFLNNYKSMSIADLSFYGKDESGELFLAEVQEVSGDEYPYVSGTWQTFDPDETKPTLTDRIDLIIVKGATSFSVHLYDPAAESGEWNVGYLDENGSGYPPTISHLSAYSTSSSVPEPATMVLLGTGLIGLAGLGRRKFKK